MKVQIYLLGYLQKYGPLHGYRLRQLISENSAEFVDIKLPTIYYHLERLQKLGYISVDKDKKGKRPERMVYSITEAGVEFFGKGLNAAMEEKYRPEFMLDAALLFENAIDSNLLRERLSNSLAELEERVQNLGGKKTDVLSQMEDKRKLMQEAVYDHQLVHGEAEVKWMRQLLQKLDNKPKYVEEGNC